MRGRMEKRHYLRKCIWCLLLIGAVVLCTVDVGWGFPGLRVQAAYERTLTKRYSKDMDQETGQWIDMAGEALNEIAARRDIMAVVYLSDRYPIRTGPSYDSPTAVTVFSGHTVNILDVYVDDDFEVWEYVNLFYKGEEYYGYIPRTFLAVSDARFLEWEENYGMNPEPAVYSVSDGDGRSSDIEQFPESYRAALYALKEKHPNWTFTKMITGMDWNEVIASQLKGSKSLVYKTFPEWAKAGLYDSGNWYFATESVLKIYMDPRNALTEEKIFQFEQLTYNEEYHKYEAVEQLLENTFMNSRQFAPGTVLTYAKIFWSLGSEKEKRNISPFHLVARVLQEQGVKGESPLISGNYPGYEGLYNYFNISASGTTDQEVIESGLKYAAIENPAINKVRWSNAYFSIMGGADFIYGNYIKQGQDTLYLQKFNVNPNGYYAPHEHQYMQNISAPTTESLNVKKLYASAIPLEESTFVFKIPVFENMPETACAEPAETLDIALKVQTGYSEPVIYLDGVAYPVEIRNGYYYLKAPDKNVKTAVAYKYNASGVPDGMYVWSLSYDGKSYRAEEQPGLADLLTAHGFSVRITGKAGIRFKTGISKDTRAALTTTGINGYTLKEYGTLTMNHANLSAYPMIRGGQKTTLGIAYGVDANGVKQDVIYETVNGRYRYAAVLVGLPVSRYKTEYAFRGYAVLEKNGQEITLYGPIRARSIYDLAKQYIDINTYAPGTDAYNFLQKLIADADADESTVSGGNAQ